MEGFIYDTLPIATATSRFMRLIRLEPVQRGCPLICTMHLVELRRSTGNDWKPEKPYSALSYVWGDPGKVESMICNDRALRITKNLWQALDGIRHTSEASMLWGDAACIDQDNWREKAKQIKLMASIFSNSVNVLIWLGLDENGSVKKTFHWLSCVVAAQKSGCCSSWYFAWHSLVTLPWFNRLWTCQELYLASMATFYCGDAEIEWDTFRRAYQILRQTGPIMEEDVMHLADQGNMRGVGSPTPENFLDLLELTRHRDCSDVRDKIFGLLSHQAARVFNSEARDYVASPNYTDSVEDCFRKVARGMIVQTRDLRTLSHVRDNCKSTFSSWAPVWQPTSRVIKDSVIWTERTPYNACGEFQLSAEDLHAIDVQNSATLSVKGIRLSTLFKIHGQIRFEGFFNSHGEWQHTGPAEKLRPARWGFTTSSSSPSLQNAMEEDLTLCPVDIGALPGSAKETGEIVGQRAGFQTHAGYKGIGPKSMRIGDILVLLHGAKVPLLLRHKFRHDIYRHDAYCVVGECIATSMMMGELAHRLGTAESECFDLI